MIIKTCPVCEKQFSVRKSDSHKYTNCSRKCGAIARTKNVSRTCGTCGSIFFVKPSILKVRKSKYCSFECSNKARIDSLPNEEIKKMYESGDTIYKIGKHFNVHGATIQYRLKKMNVSFRSASERAKGKLNPMYGKKHTSEAKQKMKDANKRQFARKGAREKHALLTIKQIQEGKTGKSYNKLEKAYADILKKQGVIFETQKRLSRFVYDFYIPETNTLIETHGTYWHADPRFYNSDSLNETQTKNKEKDIRKKELALSRGYNFKVVWESDVYSS